MILLFSLSPVSGFDFCWPFYLNGFRAPPIIVSFFLKKSCPCQSAEHWLRPKSGAATACLDVCSRELNSSTRPTEQVRRKLKIVTGEALTDALPIGSQNAVLNVLQVVFLPSNDVTHRVEELQQQKWRKLLSHSIKHGCVRDGTFLTSLFNRPLRSAWPMGICCVLRYNCLCEGMLDR